MWQNWLYQSNFSLLHLCRYGVIVWHPITWLKFFQFWRTGCKFKSCTFGCEDRRVLLLEWEQLWKRQWFMPVVCSAELNQCFRSKSSYHDNPEDFLFNKAYDAQFPLNILIFLFITGDWHVVSTATGSLVRFWAWVTFCVEFLCMYIWVSYGFSDFFPLMKHSMWTGYSKLHLCVSMWMCMYTVSCDGLACYPECSLVRLWINSDPDQDFKKSHWRWMKE